MNWKHVSIVTAVMLSAAVACDKQRESVPEEVRIVSPATSVIEVPAEGREFAITLKSTLDWSVQGYAGDVSAWVSLSPATGKGDNNSQTVNVKVLANEGAGRMAELVFFGNATHKAPFTISQKGKETGEAADISVKDFIGKADPQTEYVISGSISDVVRNNKYWGFVLNDGTGEINCPFVENWDEFPLKNGDKVSIRGKYSWYEPKKQHQLANGVIVAYEPVQVEEAPESLDPDAVAIYYFRGGQNGWTIENRNKPAEIDAIWKTSDKYGMVATGYAAEKNYDSESWLVSPVIDLVGEKEAYLSFTHAINFFKDVETAKDEASVWAREENGEWAQLDGVNYPSSQSWDFNSSDIIDLSAYAGKKMQIAFVYKSTSSKAGTWEIMSAVVLRESPYSPRTSVPAWMELPAVDPDMLFVTHAMKLSDGRAFRNYAYNYDCDARLAWWVAYPLNPALTGSGSRTDEWGFDPKVPAEYQPVLFKGFGTGHNRGHQLPSADRPKKGINESTFYFTNMTPQNSKLNQNSWASLEGKVRSWSSQFDTLYVVTGADYRNSAETVKDNAGNNVTVPDGYFKALLGYKKNTSIGSSTDGYIGIAFYFGQEDAASIMDQAMTIDALEEKLGIDFFANLPDRIGGEKADAVESTRDAWWK